MTRLKTNKQTKTPKGHTAISSILISPFPVIHKNNSFEYCSNQEKLTLSLSCDRGWPNS